MPGSGSGSSWQSSEGAGSVKLSVAKLAVPANPSISSRPELCQQAAVTRPAPGAALRAPGSRRCGLVKGRLIHCCVDHSRKLEEAGGAAKR